MVRSSLFIIIYPLDYLPLLDSTKVQLYLALDQVQMVQMGTRKQDWTRLVELLSSVAPLTLPTCSNLASWKRSSYSFYSLGRSGGPRLGNLKCSHIGHCKCNFHWKIKIFSTGRNLTTQSTMSMSRCFSPLWRMWGSGMLAEVCFLMKWLKNDQHVSINACWMWSSSN